MLGGAVGARRYLITFTPVGFERECARHAARARGVDPPVGFERECARHAARARGVDPPAGALQEIPPVTRVGPRIGEAAG